MRAVNTERRITRTGSIICENGHTRLRVIRFGSTLGLALDASSDDSSSSLQYVPLGPDCNIANHAEDDLSLQFLSFDPISLEGETSGVHMHGHLGENEADLTAILDPHGTWCRINFSITAVEPLTYSHL
ncbi:MAG TPA: hypothetical protein VHV83_17860, partial [Armatimonadota bacterium]|nr:hypothetical protein [Armatimonadota bacterium]